MEPVKHSPTSKAKVKIGSSTVNKNQNFSNAKLPPPSSLSQRKKRLAVTRGFNNNYTRREHQETTPNSSPFRPSLGSTPVFEQTEFVSGSYSEINNEEELLISPLDTGVSSIRVPVANQPLTSIRTRVISPRLPEQEVSLDWDNYNELPSFKHIGRQPTQLQFSNLQGVTGLEEINKVTLVDTSVSSLSSSSSTPNMFSNNPL